MMKVVLFALVCVASTQVFGNELEDKINAAIKDLQSFERGIKIMATHGEETIKEFKKEINTTATIHLNVMKGVENDGITVIKDTAKNLTAQAKEGKLPEDVIKCITKEEQAALSSISSYASKFETQMKELLKQKLAALDKNEKEAKKIENSIGDAMNKAAADLKKCKDTANLKETHHKHAEIFFEIYLACETVLADIDTAKMEFDRESRLLSSSTRNSINLAKNFGVKNMKDCMPKSAYISLEQIRFLLKM